MPSSAGQPLRGRAVWLRGTADHDQWCPAGFGLSVAQGLRARQAFHAACHGPVSVQSRVVGRRREGQPGGVVRPPPRKGWGTQKNVGTPGGRPSPTLEKDGAPRLFSFRGRSVGVFAGHWAERFSTVSRDLIGGLSGAGRWAAWVPIGASMVAGSLPGTGRDFVVASCRCSARAAHGWVTSRFRTFSLPGPDIGRPRGADGAAKAGPGTA